MSSFFHKKTATLVTLLAFCFAQSSYAAPPMVGALPESLGVVSGTFDAIEKTDTSRQIIHIQDAHSSLRSQEQIRHIIEDLAERRGITFVGTEGAIGPFPEYEKLRRFPVKEARERVSQYYLERGYLSGVEQAAITSDVPVYLYGVEEERTFRESYQLFYALKSVRGDILNVGEHLRRTFQKLKERVYSGALLDFERKIMLYEDGEMNLLEWAEALTRGAQEAEMPADSYAETTRLTAMALAPSAENEDRGLSKNSLKRLSPGRARKLFEEFEYLKHAIRWHLADNKSSRELVLLDRHSRLLEKVLLLEANGKDIEYFFAHAKYLTARNVWGRVASLAGRYGIAAPSELSYGTYEDRLGKADAFYRLAHKRDRILVERLLDEMGRRKSRQAILVTGGYHTDGMTAFLKSKNVSYAVVAPQLDRLEDSFPYVERMLGIAPSIPEMGRHYFIAHGRAQARFSGNVDVRNAWLSDMHRLMRDVAVFQLGRADALRDTGLISGRAHWAALRVNNSVWPGAVPGPGLHLSNADAGYFNAYMRGPSLGRFGDELAKAPFYESAVTALGKTIPDVSHGPRLTFGSSAYDVSINPAEDVRVALREQMTLERQNSGGFGALRLFETLNNLAVEVKKNPLLVDDYDYLIRHTVLPHLFDAHRYDAEAAGRAAETIGEVKPELFFTGDVFEDILSGLLRENIEWYSQKAALKLITRFLQRDRAAYARAKHFDAIWPIYVELTIQGSLEEQGVRETMLAAFSEERPHLFTEEELTELLLTYDSTLDGKWEAGRGGTYREVLEIMRAFLKVNPSAFTPYNLLVALDFLDSDMGNVQDFAIETIQIFLEAAKRPGVPSPFDGRVRREVFRRIASPFLLRTTQYSGINNLFRRFHIWMVRRYPKFARWFIGADRDPVRRENYLHAVPLLLEADRELQTIRYLRPVLKVLTENIRYTRNRRQANERMHRAAFRVIEAFVEKDPSLGRRREVLRAVRQFAQHMLDGPLRELAFVDTGIRPYAEDGEWLSRVRRRTRPISEEDDEQLGPVALAMFVMNTDVGKGIENFTPLLPEVALRHPLALPGLLIDIAGNWPSNVKRFAGEETAGGLYFALPVGREAFGTNRISQNEQLLSSLVLGADLLARKRRLEKVLGEGLFSFADVTGTNRLDRITRRYESLLEGLYTLLSSQAELQQALAEDIDVFFGTANGTVDPRLRGLTAKWHESLTTHSFADAIGVNGNTGKVRWVQREWKNGTGQDRTVLATLLRSNGLYGIDAVRAVASVDPSTTADEDRVARAVKLVRSVKQLVENAASDIEGIVAEARESRGVEGTGFGVSLLDTEVEIKRTTEGAVYFLTVPFSKVVPFRHVAALARGDAETEVSETALSVTVTLPVARFILEQPFTNLLSEDEHWSLARLLASPNNTLVIGYSMPEEIKAVQEHIGFFSEAFTPDARNRIHFVPVNKLVNINHIVVVRGKGIDAERLKFEIGKGAYWKLIGTFLHFLFVVGHIGPEAVDPAYFSFDGITYSPIPGAFAALEERIGGFYAALRSA